MIGLSQSSSSRRVGPRPELTMPKLSAPTSAACQALLQHLLVGQLATAPSPGRRGARIGAELAVLAAPADLGGDDGAELHVAAHEAGCGSCWPSRTGRKRRRRRRVVRYSASSRSSSSPPSTCSASRAMRACTRTTSFRARKHVTSRRRERTIKRDRCDIADRIGDGARRGASRALGRR